MELYTVPFIKGKRNKIILATATPMNNLAIDIIPLMNLILPLNPIGDEIPTNNRGAPGQIPRWRKEHDIEFSNQPLSYFEPYFRGRVSYVRALETGAIPQPMGDRPEVIIDGQNTQLNTSVWYCPMSTSPISISPPVPSQYEIYLRASVQRAGEKQERFYDRQRQVSNFVFPDGSYGNTGFDRYVEQVGNRHQFTNTPEGQKCREEIRNNLENLSAKYAEIVRICQEKFPGTEVVTDDSKGIVFVYFADYVRGSGAIMLGLCLKEHGYEEFMESGNIFTGTQESGNLIRSFGPCTSLSRSQGERMARISKRRRFAILTSKTPKPQISVILNTLNSYENRYGQYVQILIGSRTAREGININNAVAMVMAAGGWNASSNWQAVERVFRSTSHIARLEEIRQRTGDQNSHQCRNV